jgi:steroid delta-isomerase-like uncharacterized protein
MTSDENRKRTLLVLEKAFNHGDLSVIDQNVAVRGVDHQEVAGTDFRTHLKEAVVMMRNAFPDLHFEVHHTLAEDDIVAFHSTMTGTHLGVFLGIAATGKKIKMRHMHFLRWQDGQNTDLWHLMDIPSLMRQLNT